MPCAPGAARRGLRVTRHQLRMLHSVYGHRRRLLLHSRQHIPHGVQSRRNVFALVRVLTRLRYWALAGGAVSAKFGYDAYDEWRDSLPDLTWVSESGHRMMDLFGETENTRKRFQSFTSSLSNTAEQLLEISDKAADSFRASLPAKKVKPRSASSPGSSSDPEGDDVDENFQIQLKQQRELERLEKENKELKSKILILREKRSAKEAGERRQKKTLIELYSEILDEISRYDQGYQYHDHLPRVVVVGDQSAGKTSVLEMVAQARIFPRGAGEMMTRSPVMVTLSEGPYHVATFKDEPNRQFNLQDEKDLAALRNEIEVRMRASIQGNKAISTEVIPLDVRGPGLKRMVLVDLPGVINTVTVGMAEDTKQSIKELSEKFMKNPNAIILCIQDGSVDAERSLVTDMVSKMDPAGFRTIFVLTKIDLAATKDPKRIKQILDGKLFPMKAMGYYAVVTGKGNKNDSIADIKAYESEFFANSEFVKSGALKPHQTTTHNLTNAVSACFWKMVTDSIESQVDLYKCNRFNLETEWKNSFSSYRQLSTDEHFEKAKNEILDELLDLDALPAAFWDDMLFEKLWRANYSDLFEKVYLPAVDQPPTHFRTVSDIKLREWAESSLPVKSIEIARQSLVTQFVNIVNANKNVDPLYLGLRSTLCNEVASLEWDKRAVGSVRIIQQSALDDRSIPDSKSWTNAADFLEQLLNTFKTDVARNLSDRVGPDWKTRWTQWTSRTKDQTLRNAIQFELRKLLASEPEHASKLASDEYTAIRKNLARAAAQQLEVNNSLIDETWAPMWRLHVIENSLRQCRDCRKMYHHYTKGFTDTTNTCDNVALFLRLQRSFKTSATALRQHIVNNETRRLNQDVKDILEELQSDEDQKAALLASRRVELAEKLARIRSIQIKLNHFIKALKSEQ